ncbi:MAG: DUF2182 domain-containing protein [bacterium]|nr:DUF2182 domain-containing protein [bacterium]
MRRFQAFARQLGRGPMPWLLAASGGAFVVMAVLPHHGGLGMLCNRAREAGLPGALEAWSHLWAPARVAADWAVMVVAMMTPLVSMPIAYVRNASHPRARGAATAGFLWAYGGLWLLSAILFVPLVVAWSIVLPGVAGGLFALALAATWSASPWAQRARNRCHRTVRIGGLPGTAWSDGLRQGRATASGCIIACWPWMLVPMVVEAPHVASMLVATVYLFAERIAPLSPPAWRIPPGLESIFGSPKFARSAG